MHQRIQADSYKRNVADAAGRSREQSLWPFAGYIVVATALLSLGRIGHPFAQAVQSAGLEIAAPLVRAANFFAQPAVEVTRRFSSFRTLVEENDRLVAENQKLRSFEGRARDLEMRIKSLETLAKTVQGPKIEFVTARVVADSGGPFVRSVLIDAGRDNGLKPGLPVLSADGVAGRIVSAGQRVSRVLLTIDFNSRIPVLVGPAQERAVMEGDNSPLARLSYRSAQSDAKPGDLVVTSGVGGFFPRGLLVGRVVDTGATLRIDPSARFERLDYLSVLLFDSPSAALSGIELDSAPGTAKTGDAVTLPASPGRGGRR